MPGQLEKIKEKNSFEEAAEVDMMSNNFSQFYINEPKEQVFKTNQAMQRASGDSMEQDILPPVQTQEASKQ